MPRPIRVLAVQYSQTGQLQRVLQAVLGPLQAAEGLELTVLNLRPRQPYPWPWPFFRFFDTFPEAVHLDAPALEPLGLPEGAAFDLVVLGYQAWFLSPSLPVTAFLQSPEAARVLKDTPVVTVIACRDMWLMAQEEVKKMLAALGARLIGNVALVDEAGSIGSFLATPIWALTGSRGPHLGGLIPRAGVSEAQILAADRFGSRLLEGLRGQRPLQAGILGGLGAAEVKVKLLLTEQAVRRGFKAWGSLLRALGPQGSPARIPGVLLYLCYLLTAIIVFMPLSLLAQGLLAPLLKRRAALIQERYGAPNPD